MPLTSAPSPPPAHLLPWTAPLQPPARLPGGTSHDPNCRRTAADDISRSPGEHETPGTGIAPARLRGGWANAVEPGHSVGPILARANNVETQGAKRTAAPCNVAGWGQNGLRGTPAATAMPSQGQTKRPLRGQPAAGHLTQRVARSRAENKSERQAARRKERAQGQIGAPDTVSP